MGCYGVRVKQVWITSHGMVGYSQMAKFMWPTWGPPGSPGGPHVGHMNLAIRGVLTCSNINRHRTQHSSDRFEHRLESELHKARHILHIEPLRVYGTLKNIDRVTTDPGCTVMSGISSLVTVSHGIESHIKNIWPCVTVLYDQCTWNWVQHVATLVVKWIRLSVLAFIKHMVQGSNLALCGFLLYMCL